MIWLRDWIDSHRWHSRLCCSLFWLFALLLVVDLGVRPAAAAGEEAQHIALYVIIDSSGSMKSSDPLELRWTAVRLLVSLLDDGDEIAVLAFNSDDPDTVQQEPAVIPFLGSTDRSYGPLIRIGRDVDKETLLADLDRFAAENEPRGYTDMLAAFEAVEPLVRQARSDSLPYFIFLTDGLPALPDWSPNDWEHKLEEYVRYLSQQVGKLDVPLYAGGLWPEGACETPTEEVLFGQRLLHMMVDAALEGKAQCISGAAELPAFFLGSFGRIADRHYRRVEADGRFEVREDQEGIIQTLTLIYVEDEIGCREDGQGTLCVSIYDPNGRQLTLADLAERSEMEAWLDNDFAVISVHNPKAGAWLVDADSEKSHVILQTRLRLEIDAPEAGVSRHAAGRPLPIHVQVFQVLENGEKGSVPEGYEPTFSVQRLELIDPPDHMEPLTFNLVHDPTQGTYEARTPPLDAEGTYRVSLEAELGGFIIVKERMVYVERFPDLSVEGIAPAGVVRLLRNQQVELSLVPRLDNRMEPITELITDHVRLKCNGQPVTFTLHTTVGAPYYLAFLPPQQSNSECELKVEGIVTYLGAPYQISLEPVTFQVVLISELSMQMQNKDFGIVLPFQSLVITGASASLFADTSVNISARLLGEDPLDVSIAPQSILPGEETPLVFTLTPRHGMGLGYGHYEGTITLESSQDILVSGTKEMRYAFTLIPPSVTHDVTDGIYSLDQPFSTLEDPSGVISFQLVSQLTKPGTLSVTLTDETGQLLQAVAPNLDTTEIPVKGEQTYHLRLQQTDEADPWPADWLRSRPITFNVVLSAGPGVQVLPTDIFRVTGVRRSRLSSWWLATAETRALLGQVGLTGGLTIVGMWAAVTLGWMGITRWQHVKPTEHLVSVRMASDGESVSGRENVMALSRFNRLKHRLFGIHFWVGPPVKGMSHLPFRLFPPSAFWGWLLIAHKPDYEVNTETKVAEFQLHAERGPSNEQVYRLVNLGETLLPVRRAYGSEPEVGPKADLDLRQGDIILIGEGKGLQLGESPADISAQGEGLGLRSRYSVRRRITGDVPHRGLSGGRPLGNRSDVLKRRAKRRVQTRVSRRNSND